MLLAAGLLSPFFIEATPEIRSSYISLGRIVEDRPMQVTTVYAGYDAGSFGKFAFYNYDVSSLTDRRADVHRHALYYTVFGPSWRHVLDIADDWRITTDLKRCWTVCRGFDNKSSNATYHWWRIVRPLKTHTSCRTIGFGADSAPATISMCGWKRAGGLLCRSTSMSRPT